MNKSYRWWREHGGLWPQEIKHRLGRQPYYHIQQILLADMISRCAPAKVLEFGCGFGRHLAYVQEIPGVELFGADQSASMLVGIAQTMGEKRAAARLVRNDPLAKLPFKDKSFDVAYTVNTLLHVPPQDIGDVLAELVRVTRSRILHLEPTAGIPLDTQAHDGCFDHNYRDLYARQRVASVRAEPYCSIQEAVIVDLDRNCALPVWPRAMLQRLVQLDADLEGARTAPAPGPENPARLVQLETQLQAAMTAAGEARERLREVLASRTWRCGIRLARTPVGRLADRVLRALGR